MNDDKQVVERLGIGRIIAELSRHEEQVLVMEIARDIEREIVESPPIIPT